MYNVGFILPKNDDQLFRNSFAQLQVNLVYPFSEFTQKVVRRKTNVDKMEVGNHQGDCEIY